jgi:hypothetical protein
MITNNAKQSVCFNSRRGNASKCNPKNTFDIADLTHKSALHHTNQCNLHGILNTNRLIFPNIFFPIQRKHVSILIPGNAEKPQNDVSNEDIVTLSP